MDITIAHSPDSDDAFMHYAIAHGRIDCGPYRIDEHLADIESLNRAALEGRFEVTALSIHAYAHLATRYALLNHGGSMGEGYGPILVSKSADAHEIERGGVVAIPGEWTSAALALRLAYPRARTRVVPFDRIIDAVASGETAAGVIIHEGQLTYREAGLAAIVDLGVWWQRESEGLPLPLGGNAIRRDLGAQVIRDVSRLLRASIAWGLEHREEALTHAERFGRGLDRRQADRFVGMYVNKRTLDYADDGRRAIREFLERGAARGLVPPVRAIDFVE